MSMCDVNFPGEANFQLCTVRFPLLMRLKRSKRRFWISNIVKRSGPTPGTGGQISVRTFWPGDRCNVSQLRVGNFGVNCARIYIVKFNSCLSCNRVVKIDNFCQTSKVLSKIDFFCEKSNLVKKKKLLSNIDFFVKTRIFVKNRIFFQKLEFLSAVEIFVKNWNFRKAKNIWAELSKNFSPVQFCSKNVYVRLRPTGYSV